MVKSFQAHPETRIWATKKGHQILLRITPQIGFQVSSEIFESASKIDEYSLLFCQQAGVYVEQIYGRVGM